MKQNHFRPIYATFLFLIIFSFGFLNFHHAVYADTGSSNACPAGTTDDKSGHCIVDNPAPKQLVGTDNFATLLSSFVKIFLEFAGGIAVLFLMVGGYRYVVSAGNEEGMEKAKKTITSSLIGIVLIILAYAIVYILNTVLTK